MATFTLDARLPSGKYVTDTGLTATEIRNARANAGRLGIEILAVFRDDLPVPLSPEGVRAAFGGVS